MADTVQLEFSKEELTSLVHLLKETGIFGCDYTAAISGIRKIRNALQELEDGKARSEADSKHHKDRGAARTVRSRNGASKG